MASSEQTPRLPVNAESMERSPKRVECRGSAVFQCLQWEDHVTCGSCRERNAPFERARQRHWRFQYRRAVGGSHRRLDDFGAGHAQGPQMRPADVARAMNPESEAGLGDFSCRSPVPTPPDHSGRRCSLRAGSRRAAEPPPFFDEELRNLLIGRHACYGSISAPSTVRQ
jgi:hypothetical protein